MGHWKACGGTKTGTTRETDPTGVVEKKGHFRRSWVELKEEEEKGGIGDPSRTLKLLGLPSGQIQG